MIDDLSETLKAILQAPTVPPELAAVDVLERVGVRRRSRALADLDRR